ncbi:uncharacterized protein [Drosophila kikkawai]|uniref:Uncharacterized protein isoform X2 n=1 Tax=Drosophila kikkawai TaxID=30033 RepID=A0ABM4GLI4_DROKI
MSVKSVNSIQVCIKLRPSSSSCWLVKEGSTIQLADNHAEPMVFDCIFDEGAGNQKVFDQMAQHIVRACMQGFNGTIFAYGQSSSGKTYTMLGDGQNPGVMVLAAKEIFQQIANETERIFLLRASYIEIFNEKINDLLNKKNQDLKIHEAGNGIVTVNSEECVITSEDDLMRLFCPVQKERTVGEARTPERSCHSHAILRIIIESWEKDRKQAIHQSILNLVDLAGSERLSGDSPVGSRNGVHINKSLMFLSNVVKHLSDNKADNKYISFRDCKLTRFLQASLCGNAFTSVICTIRPSIVEETQSTLNFAMRARKIRIKPKVTKMERGTSMMERVDRKIEELQSQIAEEKRKKDNQPKVQILESQLKAEKLKIITGHLRAWRCSSSPEISKADISKVDIPETTAPLTRPSLTSKLPKPRYIEVPKCDALQAEVLALTASNQTANEKIKAYEEEVKMLKQEIVRLEMENGKLVNLKQQLDSHKAQAKELESHLLTTINERDLTIKNLQGQTLAIETMQAEYQEIQQKYNKLQEEYESLERTSSASEEQCQKLQADNTRLTCEIRIVRKRMEETQRKLMESERQESEFKSDKERQIAAQLRENDVTREELLSIKAPAVSTEQVSDSHNEQLAKISEAIHQIELKIHSGFSRLFTDFEPEMKKNEKLCLESPKHIKGETPPTDAIPLQLPPSEDTLADSYESPVKPSDEVTLAERNAEVWKLLAEKEEHLKEMQLKDSNIADLKAEIEKMGKPSILSEDNQQLVRQEQKLADHDLLIAQLKDRNVKLAESLKQAEVRQEELKKLLSKAKDELNLNEKEKTDEIKALQLEYLVDMEKSENENRLKFRQYTLELEECKDQYEREVASLKEQLLCSTVTVKEMDDLKSQHQAELGQCENTLKEKLLEAQLELEKVKAGLQDQISQAEDERNKALDELAKLRSAQEAHTAELEKTKLELDNLRRERDTLGQQKEKETVENPKAHINDLEEELRAQLEAVSNEHKELVASSKEQIQELQKRYDHLAIYTDNLRDEKAILRAKIVEADAQHSSTLRQLHELEMHKDESSQKWTTEKTDLEEKLETLKAKISDLEAELQSARLKAASLEELISQHQDLKLSLSEATGVSSTLQEKVDSLQLQLLASEKDISSRDLEKERLLSELKHALEGKDAASAEELALTTQLKAMEEKMASQEADFRKELADLNSSMNELQFKLKSLEEQKIALESDNDELKVKLKNAHNLQDQLQDEQKLCASLRTQFAELEETKTRLEEELRIKEAESRAKFLAMSQELELGRLSFKKLTNECEKLRCDLETKTKIFQKENAELIVKLRTKEDESKRLREAGINQMSAVDAANIKCRKFVEHELELTKEIDQLRITLKSKEASVLMEKESMNATISSLLEDKRNLEEKLCTLNDNIIKLEAELSALQAVKINRSNSSVESNGSLAPPTFVKPFTTNNLDHKPSVGAGVIKKSSLIDCAVRRERRKTAHDEHRKQSVWNDNRDFGTMTDPEEDRAIARKMELMKNPQKRLRRKIHDLTTREHPTDPQTVDSQT